MTKEDAIEILTLMKRQVFAESESDNALDMAIEALEQSLWIPISKEPDTAAHVLVTAKWGEDDYEVFETDYWVEKHEAEHGNEKCKHVIDHVIAWQHMPEPWKEGGKE